MNDKLFNKLFNSLITATLLTMVIMFIASILLTPKSNDTESRQSKCYVITDSQSSVYHICEEEVSSILESR